MIHGIDPVEIVEDEVKKRSPCCGASIELPRLGRQSCHIPLGLRGITLSISLDVFFDSITFNSISSAVFFVCSKFSTKVESLRVCFVIKRISGCSQSPEDIVASSTEPLQEIILKPLNFETSVMGLYLMGLYLQQDLVFILPPCESSFLFFQVRSVSLDHLSQQLVLKTSPSDGEVDQCCLSLE